MSKELILMLHATFGVLAIIFSVWVFVESLNASDANHARIRSASILVAVLMWLAYIAALGDVVKKQSMRKVVLWTAALVALMSQYKHRSPERPCRCLEVICHAAPRVQYHSRRT